MTGYSRLYSENIDFIVVAKNSVNSIVDKKIIETRTRHAVFRKNFDLRVRGTVSFLIFFES